MKVNDIEGDGESRRGEGRACHRYATRDESSEPETAVVRATGRRGRPSERSEQSSIGRHRRREEGEEGNAKD